MADLVVVGQAADRDHVLVHRVVEHDGGVVGDDGTLTTLELPNGQSTTLPGEVDRCIWHRLLPLTVDVLGHHHRRMVGADQDVDVNARLRVVAEEHAIPDPGSSEERLQVVDGDELVRLEGGLVDLGGQRVVAQRPELAPDCPQELVAQAVERCTPSVHGVRVPVRVQARAENRPVQDLVGERCLGPGRHVELGRGSHELVHADRKVGANRGADQGVRQLVRTGERQERGVHAEDDDPPLDVEVRGRHLAVGRRADGQGPAAQLLVGDAELSVAGVGRGPDVLVRHVRLVDDLDVELGQDVGVHGRQFGPGVEVVVVHDPRSHVLALGGEEGGGRGLLGRGDLDLRLGDAGRLGFGARASGEGESSDESRETHRNLQSVWVDFR